MSTIHNNRIYREKSKAKRVHKPKVHEPEMKAGLEGRVRKTQAWRNEVGQREHGGDGVALVSVPHPTLEEANAHLAAKLVDMTSMRDSWQKTARDALQAGEATQQKNQLLTDKLRLAERNIVKLETQLKTIANIANNWESSY